MSDDPLDRFARGELSAQESRELAQQSLQDPGLFEELTGSSLARMGLAKRARAWTAWLPFVGVAAAAAVVVALLLPNGLRRAQSPIVPPSPPAATSVATGPPIFLARRADPAAPIFRGAESESRLPKPTGEVVSIADGMATLDLGSLDGLAKGGEVEVLRDGNLIGRLRVTTVFRERARADAPAGLALRMSDRVRVPSPAYLRAVLDQIAALSARGDAEGARRAAAQAAAVDNVDQTDIPANGYEDANNLGAVAELRGDRATAQSLYQRALRANPPADARRSIEANLVRVRSAK